MRQGLTSRGSNHALDPEKRYCEECKELTVMTLKTYGSTRLQFFAEDLAVLAAHIPPASIPLYLAFSATEWWLFFSVRLSSKRCCDCAASGSVVDHHRSVGTSQRLLLTTV